MIAFGRCAPLRITRTNWPGRSAPVGLGSSARASLVPVRRLTRTSVKSSLPGLRVHRAVVEPQRDVEAPSFGSTSAPGVGFVLQARLLGLGNAEVHVDRVDLRHGGEQHVGAGDERAFGA